MARTPRPPARMLLAGRFVVSRASLVALPDGPVVGLDLASGDLVGLAFGPNGEERDQLESRVRCWNELALPGCPVVRELSWHLGRPLLAYEPPVPARFDGPAADAARRCAALGDTLTAAGLGLPLGPGDLILGAHGPSLRRPAIWHADTSRALPSDLLAAGVRLLEREPARVPVQAPQRARRPRSRRLLGHCVPGSARLRLGLLIGCGMLAVVAVSSGTGTWGRGAAAPRALAAPPAPAATAPVVQLPRRAHATRPEPGARGGPARVLLMPVAARVKPRVAVAPTFVQPVAASVPEPGWVAGLFVGS